MSLVELKKIGIFNKMVSHKESYFFSLDIISLFSKISWILKRTIGIVWLVKSLFLLLYSHFNSSCIWRHMLSANLEMFHPVGYIIIGYCWWKGTRQVEFKSLPSLDRWPWERRLSLSASSSLNSSVEKEI